MTSGGEDQRPVEYLCRLCGAQLEVRVSFKGKIVWTVEPGDPDFGAKEPELRGDSKEPRLLCSADALHQTGFRLVDGEIEPDPSFTG